MNKGNSDSTILTFHDDEKLNKLWNNPLKYINKFRNCMAVITPDFTIQDGMDTPLIITNIYKNRWLGCTYQQYGVGVIVSVSWAGKETYDICMSGIETGAIVAVSTVGCKGDGKKKKIFLDGYNELLRRKSPELVICFGGLIEGMKGRLLPVDYQEGFGIKQHYDYVPLFELSKILDLKGDDAYGR
mgnify:CR=1 FL=1